MTPNVFLMFHYNDPDIQRILENAKTITRHEMLSHMKEIGHMPLDVQSTIWQTISSKCPIYIQNGQMKGRVFNNYACACGRLFMFPAPWKREGKSIVADNTFNNGICPCNTCQYFIKGTGCQHQ